MEILDFHNFGHIFVYSSIKIILHTIFHNERSQQENSVQPLDTFHCDSILYTTVERVSK